MSKSKTWIVLAVAALVAGAIFAAGCGGSDNGTSGDTITQGEILAGTDAPYPPFEIGTPPDIKGYDIDVFNEVGKRLGLDVKYQDTSFNKIFGDVAAGKFDVVVAASTITAGREKTVDFSDPYYEASQALVVTPDSDIKSTDDLAGKVVGAQDGTTGEDYGNNQTDASEVRGYPQGPDSIAAVRNGQVDATIIDYPVAVDAEKKEGGIKIAQNIPTGELYGFAFAPDNDKLREDVNKQLSDMKSDGTLNDIYQKYFNTDAPKSVLNGTQKPTD